MNNQLGRIGDLMLRKPVTLTNQGRSIVNKL
jgi:hypothetical protein